MSKSEIQDFYRNQVVFITGGTGLVGKLLIEKILRVCPEIKLLYVLMRPKNGKNLKERLDQLLTSSCFDRLKIERPDFKEKIRVIRGDCELESLGLSDENLSVLQGEVSCIIHSAATIKFDENLRKAALNNVMAVRELLKIAKKNQSLKAFVHVSTAYSNCLLRKIEEKFYDPPMTADDLFELLRVVDDDMLIKATPHLMGEWPNTYTFTKNIAENVIKTEGGNLPITIIRPSIVFAPVQEPMPGWNDVIQGVLAMSTGAYLGLIRSILIKPENKFNLVPIDYVISNVLAAAWNTYTEKTNYTFRNSCMLLVRRYPSTLAVWYPFILLFETKIFAEMWIFILHTIPAYIVDFLLTCLRKKTIAVKLYKRIQHGAKLLSYFMTNTWIFHNKNVDNLWLKMNDVDRRLFKFNTDDLIWENYFKSCLFGTRKYLLKDPIETIPAARRRQNIFFVANYTCFALSLYVLYLILKLILSTLF